MEDLNTKGLTASAKGTVAVPGCNVKQKVGLNRGFPASGWGQRERKLAYKAGQVVKVDPAHTSQAMPTRQTGRRRRCSRAEPAGSKPAPTTMRRATFRRGWVFHPRPFRPVGLGLLHGEERSHGEPQRPVNRLCRLRSQAYKSHVGSVKPYGRCHRASCIEFRVKAMGGGVIRSGPWPGANIAFHSGCGHRQMRRDALRGIRRPRGAAKGDSASNRRIPLFC